MDYDQVFIAPNAVKIGYEPQYETPYGGPEYFTVGRDTKIAKPLQIITLPSGEVLKDKVWDVTNILGASQEKLSLDELAIKVKAGKVAKRIESPLALTYGVALQNGAQFGVTIKDPNSLKRYQEITQNVLLETLPEVVEPSLDAFSEKVNHPNSSGLEVLMPNYYADTVKAP